VLHEREVSNVERCAKGGKTALVRKP